MELILPFFLIGVDYYFCKLKGWIVYLSLFLMFITSEMEDKSNNGKNVVKCIFTKTKINILFFFETINIIHVEWVQGAQKNTHGQVNKATNAKCRILMKHRKKQNTHSKGTHKQESRQS